METTEDALYLKQYVNQHPDNKMAWYLLGKQYLIMGKDAKANYCFLQSGEVYDAYERKKHPLVEQPKQLLKHWNKAQRRKKLALRAVSIAAFLLLFLLLVPAPNDDGSTMSETQIDAAVQPEIGVVLVRLADRQPIGSAWNSILAWPDQPNLSLAIRLEEEDGWRKWTGNKRLLMSVDKLKGSKEFNVEMLDSAACNCEPSESETERRELEQWMAVQEQRWTLASAIHQYRKKYDSWPEKIDQLTRNYPNNVLAGETPAMAAMFPALLNAVKADQNDRDTAKPTDDKQAENAAMSPEEAAETVHRQWREPLSIVVDKATHRLAVVSGDIIVRSYPVGLGGDNTPEGSFYISEKVRNPNGKDDGQFGSRGMTLSNTLYAIHGTDEPDSIGKDESLGCIRMGKADVEELYNLVPLGTPVTIKNGTLPSKTAEPAERFRLEPRANETNPAKVYRWLG
ncbi:L,D-transpeptidase [Paenibacillus sp. NEAU-GSW1]|uniref:L,D-transpeptidase n=1 Tax=Paenibacillus sp. NEAU-GSW1 TaxID=2682486 RepID=UPI0012E1D803|nr:L,D-transpeptidase [Paenibacillus sp. NEAU-GSW1]MUT66607.1 L,D-transpeptidase family protein [Paenibacillus sp. NEAU-GSW1]